MRHFSLEVEFLDFIGNACVVRSPRIELRLMPCTNVASSSRPSDQRLNNSFSAETKRIFENCSVKREPSNASDEEPKLFVSAPALAFISLTPTKASNCELR